MNVTSMKRPSGNSALTNSRECLREAVTIQPVWEEFLPSSNFVEFLENLNGKEIEVRLRIECQEAGRDHQECIA